MTRALLLPTGLLVAFAIGALPPSASPAYGESAAEMRSRCRLVADAQVIGDTLSFPQDFDSGVCWGAFSAMQSLIVRTYVGKQRIFDVCAPPESKRSQLVAVFVEYTGRNPQHLHEDFFVVAVEAMRAAFPCPAR